RRVTAILVYTSLFQQMLRQARLSLAVTRKKSRWLAAHASILYICFLVTNKISDCGADPFHRHLNDCSAKHRSQYHDSDQDRQEQIRPLHFITVPVLFHQYHGAEGSHSCLSCFQERLPCYLPKCCPRN